MLKYLNAVALALSVCALGCSGGDEDLPRIPSLLSGDEFILEPPIAGYMTELDQREQREQIRDWAVLGTVGRLAATAEAAAAATYKLPPARLPYLDELYAFEYGPSRVVYLEGRALLFRDGDDPDPQATIARLADRVRMENGEVPASVEIYVVHDLRDEGLIRIERAADVTRNELFSPAYGYIQAVVTDVDQLAGWLDRADDLTFAQITPDGGLLLGGRRFSRTRTANLTGEDVAALYQAHDELDRPYAGARAKLAMLPADVQVAANVWLAVHADDEDGQSKAVAAISRALERLSPADQTAAAEAIMTLAARSSSPGFSLDPELLPDPKSPRQPLLLGKLRAFADDPCGQLEAIARVAGVLEKQEPDSTRRTARTSSALSVRHGVAAVRQALELPEVCTTITQLVSEPLRNIAVAPMDTAPAEWETKLIDYYRLIETLRTVTSPSEMASAELARSALEFYKYDSTVQCGRFEGTNGTLVGMTLFYTDLLAKLWESTDFGLSAPVIAVPGFIAEPRNPLPRWFEEESWSNPYTRVWFGPHPDGVSQTATSERPSWQFAHRFSRVYAAGSNPTRPGIEVQPDEASRQALGWWDRHFDDVADYEQEYHRQNQIMKWALVTGALTDGPLVRSLRATTVDRSFNFPVWYAENRSRLRFSDALPPPQALIAGKQCLPLLTSYPFPSYGDVRVITGGVSTVGRTGANLVSRVVPNAQLGARVTTSTSARLAGKAGTATRAAPKLAAKEVSFVNTAGARTRTIAGDVRIGTPVVKYGKSGRQLTIRAGDETAPIGELAIEARSGRSLLKWKDGRVEIARRSGREIPNSVAAADDLAGQGYIASAARHFERLTPSAVPTPNELARSIVVDAAYLRPRAVLDKLNQLGLRSVELSPEARQALGYATHRVGTSAAARHVRTSMATSTRDVGDRLIVRRGELIVSRDVARLETQPVARTTAAELSSEIYIDSRLRVGREGLLPDVGSELARWRNVPGVRLEQVQRSTIGELPDQLIEKSTKTTFDRVVRDPWPGELVFAATVLVIRRDCDAGKRTKTTADDCAR